MERTLPRRLTLALVVAATLAACGQKNTESMVQSARDALAKKDYAAAGIQLKNALQKKEDPEVRFMLATVLVEQGDPAAAQQQLKRALEAGLAGDAVRLTQAKVLLGVGDYRKLVAELGGEQVADPAATAFIQTALGEAHFALAQPKEARQAFDRALAAQPGDPRVRAGLARLIASEGDVAGANKAVDEILAAHPGQFQAQALKADLLIADGKTDEAIKVLNAMVAAAPTNGQPRFALINLLLGSNRLDEAATAIAAMKKDVPGDLRSRYFEAMLAFRKQQPAQARDAAMQVLNAAPDHVPSLVIAGASEYQLGQLATAESHLRKVLAAAPNNLYARNLLTATYLKRGQAAKAEEAIAPAVLNSPKDPTVLRAAGEAAFANNKIAEAARFYEQALELEKDNAATRTRLAQIRMATGDTQRALSELELASGVDQKAFQADLALIATHLTRKDFDKALAAVAVLEKKQPDNPLTHAARGSVLAAKRDAKGARVALEKALALQPSYLPAARMLAALDLAEDKPADARARLQKIADKDPANDGALLALADVMLASKGSPSEVRAVVEKAVKANPTSVAARIALARLLGQQGDAKGAVAAAQEAVKAMPKEAALLDMLGTAQLAAGDTAQAVDTYRKLVAQQPDSHQALMRLASAQFAAKERDAPIETLRQALALKPDALEARRQLIGMQVAAGRTEEALKESRAVQRARPKDALGYALEGDVLLAQKKNLEAAAAFGEGVKRHAAPELVVKQHQALLAAGKAAEADAVAARWMKDKPQDPVVRFHLANVDLQQGKHAEAAKRFREILAANPNNFEVMNNLAWTLGEMNDPGAIPMAEQAASRAPGNADVLDTLGWLLVNKGDAKRGVETLARASSLAPRSTQIRLHYAKALAKTGDKAGARREAEALTKEANPHKAEAEALLKSL